MKIRFDKRPYNISTKYKIGVLVFISPSHYGNHRRVICLTLTFLNTQYGVSLHFGRRTYPEMAFKPYDLVVCVNSEETVQLREGVAYMVDRVDYKASQFDDNAMSGRVHLSGMADHITYEQERFRLAEPLDFPGGPVS